MNLSSVLETITTNTLPDSWNEIAIGRIAYTQFEIQSPDDLWRINSAIIYRNPTITDFKHQYYQKAGFTFYTLEGTCIDIARATQMTAMANIKWNPFIIIVFDDKGVGHAFNLIFTISGITIFDFNHEVTYKVDDSYNKFMKNQNDFRTSLINQLAYMVSEQQNLIIQNFFMIQIGTTSTKSTASPTILFSHDYSSDITQPIPVVGVEKNYPDSQLAVAKYIGNRNIEWKIILELYPYALGIIIGILILLLIL